MTAKTIESHVACDLCGSSDARTVYEDDEGKQFWKCYACEGTGQLSSDVVHVVPAQSVPGNIRAIPERDITADVARFYGITDNGKEWCFPYNGGYKARLKAEKNFYAVGKPKGLFGQDRFAAGGKFVTLTEGEFDAAAAFSMMGARYPCVSIRRGAATAIQDVREAYEWLDTFDKVVICFDNDAKGQEAARKVAEIFSHKALITKLVKYKDANEYLSNQCAKEFVDAWWRAEPYTPDGIVQGSTLWEDINKPRKNADVLYPFDSLNKLTYGLRKGELVMVTSGSGMGKTQFLRELAYQMIDKTEDNIGLMFLEESNVKTGVGLMSVAANIPFHIPDTDYTPAEYKSAFDKTLGTGRVYLFDHFGSSGIDNIIARVRYLAKACNCGFVFLDHISIVVSSQENGDERKALDEIMTKLRTLVQETGIALICVSHLKRPDGKGHEEGAFTSLAQLRGSGSIAQLSDIVLGLERNGQADDEIERNITRFRVLKNRFCGITGPAGEALYNHSTGRMLEKTEEAL